MSDRQRLVIGYTCRLQGHRHTTEAEASECIRKTGWLEFFEPRQQKEIALAMLYAEQFNHGTDGHNAKMIIAQMALLLMAWWDEKTSRNDLEAAENLAWTADAVHPHEDGKGDHPAGDNLLVHG